MNCVEIIKIYLIRHGFDGLCNGDAECGCGIKDLNPCDSDISLCEPAYDHGPRFDFDNFYSTEKPKKDNPHHAVEKEE